MIKMDDGISKQKEERIKEKIEQLREDQESKAVQAMIEFTKTPSQLKADMDRFVVGQEQGKKIMCTAISFHYRRLGQALKKGLADSHGDIDVALRNTIAPKANIMIIGPTGCGKTYTSETASNLVGVSFVHEDMTKFSEVGYVGQNAGDILLDLLLAAGGNPNVARMGIVSLTRMFPAEACKKDCCIWSTAWKTLSMSAKKEFPCQRNTCCSLPAAHLKISTLS
jgi:ATP-dependent Clp protease ATP-binding subunit ClpX